MKKFLLIFTAVAIVSAAVFYVGNTSAQTEKESAESPLVSPNIVISQIYGGGGLTGAQYTHDFVELFNRGTSAVNLNNWSVQYASASGSNWLPASPLPTFNLQPGQYFLIQFASNGAIGSGLPSPDFVAPVIQPEGFIPNLSSTTGKLSLVNHPNRLAASTCPVDSAIIDFLGYGASASCFEGAGRAPDLTATTGMKRNGNGCDDTDNNNSDFTVGTPAPRNSASPTNTCNLGSQLQAGMTANPNNVNPGGDTLLRVTVIPATTPPSTFIAVAANLSSIGGASSQPFYDDGTHGDTVPGDNVFTFLATVAPGTSGGIAPIVGAAADFEGRVAVVQVILTINAPLPNEDPLIFGNPSNATNNIANENNYLMQKAQYSLSYNKSKATPNWVAWRLDSTWVGSAPRQDDYRPDPALPSGWYQVQDGDYTGSGYDRGHMCPSGDRTRSIPDNSATFLMTNFVPQLAANNQGPWEEFETYCRTLAAQGNEIYIITGPVGGIGTIASGQIVVPQYTWKVVLVIPNGNNDVLRASTRATRVFGIIVPNFPPLNINAPWRDFRVTVDQVEYTTGFNFFSEIPKNTQELIERKRDRL